jgi:hypothetical protein
MSMEVADGLHHEESTSMQSAFVNDVSKLITTLFDWGNPFEDQGDPVVLHNRNIMTAEAAEQGKKVFDVGKRQYEEFVATRLSDTSVSLFAPIKRNKMSFFVQRKQPRASKLKSKITASRNDATLCARLYIACQIRNSDLDEFFRHENQVFPPSLSDSGNIHFGCKSDLLSCLDSLCPTVATAPCIDALIIDGAVVVNILKPGSAITFDDYANKVIIPYIESHLSSVYRIDVVWDRYGCASVMTLGSGLLPPVISPFNLHSY